MSTVLQFIVLVCCYPFNKRRSAECQNVIGHAYEEGIFFLKKDKKRAMQSFKRAANLGSPEAWSNLGRMYEEIKNDKEATIECYKKASELGDPWADVALASMFADEASSFHDENEALAYCWRAYERGYAYASYTLSGFYFHGVGVKIDEDQAFHYCLEAVEKGVKKARGRLEKFLDYGSGSPEERDRAKRIIAGEKINSGSK